MSLRRSKKKSLTFETGLRSHSSCTWWSRFGTETLHSTNVKWSLFLKKNNKEHHHHHAIPIEHMPYALELQGLRAFKLNNTHYSLFTCDLASESFVEVIDPCLCHYVVNGAFTFFHPALATTRSLLAPSRRTVPRSPRRAPPPAVCSAAACPAGTCGDPWPASTALDQPCSHFFLAARGLGASALTLFALPSAGSASSLASAPSAPPSESLLPRHLPLMRRPSAAHPLCAAAGAPAAPSAAPARSRGPRARSARSARSPRWCASRAARLGTAPRRRASACDWRVRRTPVQPAPARSYKRPARRGAGDLIVLAAARQRVQLPLPLSSAAALLAQSSAAALLSSEPLLCFLFARV